jgi:hypothetical protein
MTHSKFIRIFEKIASGILIGLGVSIALGGWVYYMEETEDDDRRKQLDISSVEIQTIRFVDVGRYPSVSVALSNLVTKRIDIRLEAELSDSDGLYGTCVDWVELDPSEAREISIKCGNFESSKIPSSTTVDIRIVRVSVDEGS